MSSSYLNKTDLNVYLFVFVHSFIFLFLFCFKPMLAILTYHLLLHICASCPVTPAILLGPPQTSSPAWPATKQNRKITSLWFTLLVVLPPRLPNCLFPPLLIWFFWQAIALWLTSTLHKSPVQMSWDVYYKGLDLEQVGEVGPLALMACVCFCVRWRRVQEYVYRLLGLHITEAVYSQGNNALILIRS